jgi:hypothetical protein
MNDLCADIGWRSANHFGEQLCGDHIDVIEQEDGTTVIVLADGLGSGVKASILSTLTSKMLSTMVCEGLSIEECVRTLAETLPVCSVRKVAYSTFTMIRLAGSVAEIVQYDNPMVIFLRDGQEYDYDKTEMNVDGKQIYTSRVKLQEGDILIAMSDGCVHAGVGRVLNFGWKRSDIVDYMKTYYDAGFTAKTLSTVLLEECVRLYGGEPGDDTSVCSVRIRKRAAINLLFGPPADREDNDKMMSLFFSKEGKHIVCGGTTSSIAAKYLHKSVRVELQASDPEIPPIAHIDGVDLVTEGVITINKVLEYARDYLADNESYVKWSYKHDGASLISRLLFEEATDINFFVGRAINPAHQNPDLPINFSIKMNLVTDLSACLEKMGKRVKVSYF